MNKIIVVALAAMTSCACNTTSEGLTSPTNLNLINTSRRPRAVTCNVSATTAIPNVLLTVNGNWLGDATNAVIATESGTSVVGTSTNPFSVSLPIYFPGPHDVLLSVYRNGTLMCQAITRVAQ